MTKCEQEILMKSFRANPYPTKEEKCQLAMSLNTSQKVIQIWFGNCRQREKNKREMKRSE